MGNIRNLYKQSNGGVYLKQCLKNKTLGLAFAEVLLLGITRKSLEITRNATEFLVYKRLKKQNIKFIKDYLEENKNIKHEHNHRNTIWTIWLQGMENAPIIVQKCYESMKKNITNKEIVVITENNYSDYVQFPDYIMEKYKNGIISKVHFSDLLRIELMARYGGTWLDGTVFVSGNPEDYKQEYILNDDLFLFQTLKPGLDGHAVSISSWLMTASSNNKIILLTRALLHNYWKTHNNALDYFILHIFFQIAIETYPEEWRKVVPFSNSIPHIFLLRLFDNYDEHIWDALKNMSCFHKLSYKFTEDKWEKSNTFYREILENGK